MVQERRGPGLVNRPVRWAHRKWTRWMGQSQMNPLGRPIANGPIGWAHREPGRGQCCWSSWTGPDRIGRDGTEPDGTGRDETGRDGTGTDGGLSRIQPVDIAVGMAVVGFASELAESLHN